MSDEPKEPEAPALSALEILNSTEASTLGEECIVPTAELLKKNPLQMTDAERKAIIEALREGRKTYRKASAKRKATRAKNKKTSHPGLSLDDIGGIDL